MLDHAIVDATGGGSKPPTPNDGLTGLARSRYAMVLANRPLIWHVLSELAASGITQATVLVGPSTADVVDELLVGWDDEPEVTLRALPGESSRRAMALAVATLLDQENGRPSLLHPGDCLFGPPLAALCDHYRAGDVDAVLAAEHTVATHHTSTTLLGDGAMVLAPSARPLLHALAQAPSDSLSELVLHSGLRLAVATLDGRWSFNSATDALLAANRRLLDDLPADPPQPPVAPVAQDSSMAGRITVGEGAFISNCVIHGPVAIAQRAVLEDSFVGPFTAIGADVILSGTEIDNAIVLAGAELRHPGQRIEASIIGARARVGRSFDLPSGLHLRLGADGRVGFS